VTSVTRVFAQAKGKVNCLLPGYWKCGNEAVESTLGCNYFALVITSCRPSACEYFAFLIFNQSMLLLLQMPRLRLATIPSKQCCKMPQSRLLATGFCVERGPPFLPGQVI
jgi:hypothetical protein